MNLKTIWRADTPRNRFWLVIGALAIAAAVGALIYACFLPIKL